MQLKFRKSQMLYCCFCIEMPACKARDRKQEGIPVMLSSWCFILGPKMEVNEGTNIGFVVEICCGSGINIYVIVSYQDSIIFSVS